MRMSIRNLTLDRVVDAVNPPRDPSRHPLFQAMFVLQNNEPASLDGLGLKIKPFAEKPMQSAFFEFAGVRRDRARFRGFAKLQYRLYSVPTPSSG